MKSDCRAFQQTRLAIKWRNNDNILHKTIIYFAINIHSLDIRVVEKVFYRAAQVTVSSAATTESTNVSNSAAVAAPAPPAGVIVNASKAANWKES